MRGKGGEEGGVEGNGTFLSSSASLTVPVAGVESDLTNVEGLRGRNLLLGRVPPGVAGLVVSRSDSSATEVRISTWVCGSDGKLAKEIFLPPFAILVPGIR